MWVSMNGLGGWRYIEDNLGVAFMLKWKHTCSIPTRKLGLHRFRMNCFHSDRCFFIFNVKTRASKCRILFLFLWDIPWNLPSLRSWWDSLHFPPSWMRCTHYSYPQCITIVIVGGARLYRGAILNVLVHYILY